jgi:Kef-type K+ transport system membrane component KefB
MTDRQTRDENSSGSIFTPRQIIGLIALALFLAFAFQNSPQGEIGLLWLNISAPIWAFFIIIFALGWIAGWVSHGRSKNPKNR